jgi:hypothetical protein
LSLGMKIKNGTRLTAHYRFITKIQWKHPETKTLGVFHRAKDTDHIHLLIGAASSITSDEVQQAWKSHYPGKKFSDYKPQYASCKPAKRPKGALFYLLFGRKGNWRMKHPWSDLPKRCPVFTRI